MTMKLTIEGPIGCGKTRLAEQIEIILLRQGKKVYHFDGAIKVTRATRAAQAAGMDVVIETRQTPGFYAKEKK